MLITYIKNARIGIATEFGKPYYRFSKTLKALGINFDSILPQEITSFDGDLILTTEKEAPKHPTIPLLFDDITEKDIVVIHGLIAQKIDSGLNQGQLLLGIDPGKQIGLSVYYLGNEISNSFFFSTEKLIDHVINILAELKAKQKIIKIGNGDMQMANEIVKLLNLKFCSNFEIEIVDERSTTLKIKNFNQRGKRDMLSAQFITQRNGYWKSVLPLSITG